MELLEIYLFSDAHFGFLNNEKEKFEKFKVFAKRAKKNAKKFIIIGDLFDFWFEYNSVIFSHYFKILAELYEISKDIETIYIAGNHDLWIGDFFRSINITPIVGKYEIILNNKKIIIAHGDDLKFRIKTRDILSNSILVKLFKLVHPDLGISIARFISKASRKMHDKYPSKIPQWLWNYFSKIEGDILIVGHLHSPIYDIRNNKKIACIGDWIYHFTYAILTEKELKVLNLSEEIIYTLNL